MPASWACWPKNTAYLVPVSSASVPMSMFLGCCVLPSSCSTSVMIIPFYTLRYLPSTWSPHNKFHPSTAHIQATWIRDSHQPTGISHPGNNNWVPMVFGALCFYSNLIVTVIRAHVLFNSVFLVPGTYKSLELNKWMTYKQVRIWLSSIVAWKWTRYWHIAHSQQRCVSLASAHNKLYNSNCKCHSHSALDKCSSKSYVNLNHLKFVLKCRFLSRSWGWGLRLRVSSKFPGRPTLLAQVARLHLISRGSWSAERNNMFLKMYR